MEEVVDMRLAVDADIQAHPLAVEVEIDLGNVWPL